MEIIVSQQKELKTFFNREIELINEINKEKWSFNAYTSPIEVLPIVKVGNFVND